MNETGQQGFTTLLSSLSQDPLVRGKQFERLVKWWIPQDPIRSLDVKQVWLWDEWPERSGRDIGIDLVAEMFDGSLCAIQAKCFDENRDIPKSELDSFISAASHRTFEHRWLVATTDRLSANARRMLADQHVTRILRSDLEESLSIWPASIKELNPIAQPKWAPRPHQDIAITDVVEGFKVNNRGQLIMACGTGKTLTALWIKETLTPKTTLVLVPSLNLLAQTLAEWAKNTSSPWNYLCVCSDETVNKSDDAPISTVGDFPFDVTTDFEKIASFLAISGEKIIFSTYQSSAQVAKAQERCGVPFDLVICDEAHRLTGKTNAAYATALDDSKILADKRLFMTATPRTYTVAAKSKAEDRGVEITSMDDEHIYGPVLHKLSFGEAIEQELLSDYRVLIVGVTDTQVQELIDRRELVSVNDSVITDARTLAAHIGLAKATKDYNLKRTISFHSRIKTADQFARDHLKILDWLPESHKPSGNTWTGTISGAMNTGDRRKLLNQLRIDDSERHALLTNARCLTEGVDVANLDGVAFIDPRSSQVDIIQAVGRAIRKSENKEVGTIVLPVLIPTDSNAEHALDDTAFKPIWAILNALKSHDDKFAFELNNLRTELGRTGKTGNFPVRLIEDLPSDIDFILPGFSQKLSIALLEHSTSSWNWWFGLLLKHTERFGNAKVLMDKKNRDPLSTWVSTQRGDFKIDSLSSEKVRLLEGLPGWTWDPHEEIWNETYSLLCGYLHQSGNVYPTKGAGLNDVDLGGWISRQRMLYFNSKIDSIRIRRLEDLPGWHWDPQSMRWNQFYRALVSHSLNSKIQKIPNDFVIDGLGVGRWMIYQRVLFRNNALEQNRIEQLEALDGWNWNPEDDSWLESFEALQRYVAQNGNCLVPAKLTYGDIPLGRWVTNQRFRHRRKLLPESRIKKLESLPNWSWNPRHDDWETAFRLLLQFALREGHANPLVNHKEDGFMLGSWVSSQRRMFRLGELEDYLFKQLNDLKGWEWQGDLGRAGNNPRVIDFTLSLAHTHPELCEEFDHDTNTVFTARNLTAGSNRKVRWICSKDASHTWAATVANRTQRFSGCPHCRNRTTIAIAGLIQFIAREGHSRVPSRHIEDNYKLGQWVANRRSTYRTNRMPPSLIEEMEKIEGWQW